jgi:ribonuclease-3
MENIDLLQETLGLRFKDTSLLKQALIHDSYVNENPDITPSSNERFEFLGDAVLSLIFAAELYREFPSFTEGELTRFRSLLVRGVTLARLARDINLGDFLYLGRGEELSGGRHKASNLAAAMEALIAAIYLDQGIDTTRDFILNIFKEQLEEIASRKTAVDHKSRLQHVIQAHYQETPEYRILDTTGPDHDRRFAAEVFISQNVLGEGFGKSKKQAETAAARAALSKLANTLHSNSSLLD